MDETPVTPIKGKKNVLEAIESMKRTGSEDIIARVSIMPVVPWRLKEARRRGSDAERLLLETAIKDHYAMDTDAFVHLKRCGLVHMFPGYRVGIAMIRGNASSIRRALESDLVTDAEIDQTPYISFNSSSFDKTDEDSAEYWAEVERREANGEMEFTPPPPRNSIVRKIRGAPIRIKTDTRFIPGNGAPCNDDHRHLRMIHQLVSSSPGILMPDLVTQLRAKITEDSRQEPEVIVRYWVRQARDRDLFVLE